MAIISSSIKILFKPVLLLPSPLLQPSFYLEGREMGKNNLFDICTFIGKNIKIQLYKLQLLTNFQSIIS